MANQFPFYASTTEATFYIQGQWWSILSEHKHFGQIVKILQEERAEDGLEILSLVSDEEFLKDVSGGRLSVDKGKILLDGTELSTEWQKAIRDNPDNARVLFLKEGDIITVAGDEDAPDGEYPITSIDTSDVASSVYLETDDGFFGYVKNSSIKASRNA